MARYEFDGQQIEAPDGMDPQEIVRLVNESKQQQVAPSPSPGEVAPDPQGQRVATTQTNPVETATAVGSGSIDPDTLSHNADWLAASRIMYRKTTGTDFNGSDEDLATVGLNQMGWFNYNLPKMGVDAAMLATADPEQKKAFLYLMETYDNLGYSWGGAWRAVKGMALDPTTYVGLSTFGIGTVAGQATKVASKEGLKQLLKIGVRTGIEGAVYGAASDAIKQTAEINAGGKTDFSYGQTAGAAAIGGAAGFVLGGAADGIGTALRKEKPWTKFERSAETPGTAPEAGKVAEAPTLAEGTAKAAPEAPVAADVAKVADAGPHDVVLPEIIVPEHAPKAPKAEPEVGAAIPEAPTSTNSIIEAVRAVSEESGARVFPQGRAEANEASQKAIQLLTSVKPEEVTAIVEQLRRTATTPEETFTLHNTFKNATDRLEAQTRLLFSQVQAETDEAAKAEIFKAYAQSKQLRDNIKAGDTALSSADGRTLGDRRGAFNTGERRDLSEETILAAEGIDPAKATPAQKTWAEHEYYNQVDQWANKVKDTNQAKTLEGEIAKAYEADDKALAIQLSGERRALTDKLIRDEQAKQGMVTKVAGVGGKGMAYLNEFIISTVFTTSTLAVNVAPSLIKTVYRPALDYAMRGPLDLAAYRQMTATYSTMFHSMGFAFDAAKAAFMYEKSLLSTEPNRLLGDQAAFGGRFGRTLRTFPRLLNTTDEFFAQLNYRGFAVGNATSDAIEKGLEAGLKGKELEAHVTAYVDDFVKNKMFSKDIDAPKVIDFLRSQAMDRGLTGAKLETWVMTQLDKDKELFKQALSQSGKDYADDLLFKRRFSGENAPSRMAAGYEKFVNENPIMRPLGQLFFRTPVRVFEEGLRMTPGLNLLAPKMMKDLLGKNGEAAQVKANGQMLLSYAMAAWAMTKYAEGNLTSGGPSDYKLKRGRENAGDWQPYSLRVGGQNVSLRNLDPLATLLKIVPNVMDRMAELEYRKGQGEFVDDKQKEAMAWLSVAVGSTASAVADANLFSGIAELEKLRKGVMDPEHNDMTFTRFFASKAQLAVPNQIGKIVSQNVPDMNDPVTFEQYLRARINPGDPKVPKQYDALGMPRSVANPTGLLTGLNMASDEQLKRGRSPKEIAVLKELSKLEIASGGSIGVWPAKSSEYGLGGQDLRTIYTKSGKSYYDRLQEIYRSFPVTNTLYNAIVQRQGGTLGTRQVDGSRVETAKTIINTFRDASMARLLKEESGMREEYLKAERFKNDARRGKFDSPIQLYK